MWKRAAEMNEMERTDRPSERVQERRVCVWERERRISKCTHSVVLTDTTFRLVLALNLSYALDWLWVFFFSSSFGRHNTGRKDLKRITLRTDLSKTILFQLRFLLTVRSSNKGIVMMNFLLCMFGYFLNILIERVSYTWLCIFSYKPNNRIFLFWGQLCTHYRKQHQVNFLTLEL